VPPTLRLAAVGIELALSEDETVRDRPVVQEEREMSEVPQRRIRLRRLGGLARHVVARELEQWRRAR